MDISDYGESYRHVRFADAGSMLVKYLPAEPLLPRRLDLEPEDHLESARLTLEEWREPKQPQQERRDP